MSCNGRLVFEISHDLSQIPRFYQPPNCVQTLSKGKNSRCYRLHTVHMKLCKVGLTPDFFPSTSLDLYIVGKILKTSVLVSKQSKIIFTKKSATYVRVPLYTYMEMEKGFLAVWGYILMGSVGFECR